MVITPEKALDLLVALKKGDITALQWIPNQGDLPTELVKLSDTICASRPPLTVIRKEPCVHRGLAEPFTREALPLSEMGQYAIHLTYCDECRTAISRLGISIFLRSNAILRQTLGLVETDDKPTF